MTVKITGKYQAGLRHLISRDINYEKKVDQAISWFKKNKNDTRLRLHPLKGRLKGRWAFSVDDDVRIVFKPIGAHRIRLFAIGAHAEVYKRE